MSPFSIKKLMNIKKINKLLKSRDRRHCYACGKMLKYKEFGYVEYESGKYKFRSPCKICENEKQRSDPNRYKYTFKKHNIDENDYISLVKSQNYVCAICGKKEIGKRRRRLFVDHNHETNIIRGLLCSKCNSIIGFCGEDINILKSAILYLKYHKYCGIPELVTGRPHKP